MKPIHQSNVREEVRNRILAAGFDRVGFARAGPAPHAGRLEEWLRRGFAGSMDYIERSRERRSDPCRVVAGARTVVVVALHYAPPSTPPPRALSDEAPDRGCIAAYALGEDYHRVMERRLKRLCGDLGDAFPGTYRYYVDTGPVLERDWAQNAGIGWIGKNTCSIDPVHGSYFFLGVIITTLELPPDDPAPNHCGTCRLCLDACPTDAFDGAYQLDARRCISYLTIEHRGEVSPALEESTANLIFGCDICQQVCPYNQQTETLPPGDVELAPRPENVMPSLAELANLDQEAFRRRFPRSPLRRPKFAGFLRNIIVALGNSRHPAARPTLERLANTEAVQNDPGARATLGRALKRLLR